MHIHPYDYHSDLPSDTCGLARTAGLILAARGEAANTLLLDNGDFLQGSPLGDYIDEVRGLTANPLHPMIAAMNHLGYDAATLGNHEFSHGLDFLIAALERARFPIVSANVTTIGGGRHLVAPWILLDRQVTDGAGVCHALRIGVIGFLPSQTAVWDKRHLEGQVEMLDILTAAHRFVPDLRAAGADIVVALSHSGIAGADAPRNTEYDTTALAALQGIDALVAGHTHQVFPSADFKALSDADIARGTLLGKPVVMPGFNGSHLGVIDLLLDHGPDGWRVADHQSSARPIAARRADGLAEALTVSDPGVLDLVAEDHGAALCWTRRAIGRTPVPLHSYFALVSDSASVRLVAEAQAAYVANRLRGTPHADLPVLSAAAPFKAGCRGGPENFTFIPAGEMALRDAANLYIHPNTIAAVRVTGAEVADWLERSVSLFNQITPGAQYARLINPDVPSFQFDTILGLTYRIDLSQPRRFDETGTLVGPAARRIVDLRWNDRPVEPEAVFALATNSYRTSGAGGYFSTDPECLILSDPVASRDVVVAHIARKGPRTDGAASWRFVPMPGTTVLCYTSPLAEEFMPEIADLFPEPLGIDDCGFLRFRIRL